MQFARQPGPISLMAATGANDEDRTLAWDGQWKPRSSREPLGLISGWESPRDWVRLGLCMLLLVGLGCTPPRGMDEPAAPPAAETPQPKAPASTAYGKALEAADRLKSQAEDYNDRLEKLSDPSIK